MSTQVVRLHAPKDADANFPQPPGLRHSTDGNGVGSNTSKVQPLEAPRVGHHGASRGTVGGHRSVSSALPFSGNNRAWEKTSNTQPRLSGLPFMNVCAPPILKAMNLQPTSGRGAR